MEEKQAALWHAFNALDDQNKGTGMKSQLKVCRAVIAVYLYEVSMSFIQLMVLLCSFENQVIKIGFVTSVISLCLVCQ